MQQHVLRGVCATQHRQMFSCVQQQVGVHIWTRLWHSHRSCWTVQKDRCLCERGTEGALPPGSRAAPHPQEGKASKTKFDLGTELWPLLPEQQQLRVTRSRKLKSETVFRKSVISPQVHT